MRYKRVQSLINSGIYCVLTLDCMHDITNTHVIAQCLIECLLCLSAQPWWQISCLPCQASSAFQAGSFLVQSSKVAAINNQLRFHLLLPNAGGMSLAATFLETQIIDVALETQLVGSSQLFYLTT